jgi:hypothetical protein
VGVTISKLLSVCEQDNNGAVCDFLGSFQVHFGRRQQQQRSRERDDDKEQKQQDEEDADARQNVFEADMGGVWWWCVVVVSCLSANTTTAVTQARWRAAALRCVALSLPWFPW